MSITPIERAENAPILSPAPAIAPAAPPDPPRWIYLRDLIRELVVRDLKLQYQRSVLGYLWSQVNPLLQLTVFVLMFQHLFKLQIPHYALYVFVAVLAWNWYSSCIHQAATSITNNADLIRKPDFPTAVLPAVTVATQLAQFVLALPVVFLFAHFAGGSVNWSVLALIPVIALQFLLCLGIGYLVAALNVAFRDVQHLLGALLLLQFYLTPVFYSAAGVPAKDRTLYDLNPMVRLVEAYRSILIGGTWPPAMHLVTLGVAAVALTFVSHHIFHRMKDRFAEELS